MAPLLEKKFIAHALTYSVRSLIRHKTRTLLTAGTIMLSVTVSIVANQYAKAVLSIWQKASIDRGTAHAQLHMHGFFDAPDALTLETSFDDEKSLRKDLEVDPSVDHVSRRLLLEGIISARGKSVYFLGKAVDGPAELLVSTHLFAESAESGSFVSSSAPDKVVLGRGLAEALDLKIGDPASVMVSTVHGAVNGLDVIIGGIIDLPIAILSKRLLYMDLKAAQKAVEMPNHYNELAVRLKPDVDPHAWVENVSTLAVTKPYDLRGWWDIDKIIVKAQNLWDAVVRIVSALLFMTAGLSVLNMILMLVSEQTIEIGTLLAIGAGRKHIYWLVGFQAGVLGLVGAASGCILANVLILLMDAVGIPFESPFGGGIFLVHPKMSLLSTAVAFIMGCVVATIASIIPAQKASRLEPVIAFRGQVP